MKKVKLNTIIRCGLLSFCCLMSLGVVARASVLNYPGSVSYSRGVILHRAKRYQEAYGFFLNAAAEGNPYAIAQVGEYAVLGFGAAQIDYQRARDEFNHALRIVPNFKPAYEGFCRLTARQYFQSHKASYLKEATDYCTKAGDASFALYNLGIFVKDNKKAFNYFLRAAKQGYQRAMRRTAFFYAVGIGTKQDKKQAAYWFTQCMNRYHDKICHDALAKLNKGHDG